MIPGDNMDALLVNSRLRVCKEQVLHIRKRMPSLRGKVHVAVGQEVSPGDILGEGQTQVGFRTIHLTSELGVDPKQVARHLKPKIGQTIFQGELLAEGKYLFGMRKKLITSPVDGVVDCIDEEKGNLRLKLVPKPSKLISGVYGVVDALDNNKNSRVGRGFNKFQANYRKYAGVNYSRGWDGASRGLAKVGCLRGCGDNFRGD
ncbi:MAG: hypothetical protein UV41_C0007G0004 [Candidatus Daviesbacteria bacterium GW2011_GWA2_42_7]|uniref:Uncharacterized protein n=1 Tax=Candidatus Daviesbacteria bacterium GW2011_GWA2_42_7 TaxID=1618425 RepID=A0A0G1BCT8_9BACT|nr:MAG: hypothetical protein UV41_C0007G0004 [Candidatus Daviesbacteria bacterium GW2011_GWA2_42_7]